MLLEFYKFHARKVMTIFHFIDVIDVTVNHSFVVKSILCSYQFHIE